MEQESTTSHNVVILRGTLSCEPLVRELPSGASICQLEVTTRVDDVALTVPVVEPHASKATSSLGVGADVVVTGAVKRRFFRAGGQTQSRTEVVATKVLPARMHKRVANAVAAAVSELDAYS